MQRFANTSLGLALVLAAFVTQGAGKASATDLNYVLMSPNFGGSNGIGLQDAQLVKGLRASELAARRAAQAAKEPSGGAGGANQQFVNAIISQLNGLVAYKIAAGIANSQPGSSGTVQSGGTTITYVNQDGQLTVTFTGASGSTTLTIPTSF